MNATKRTDGNGKTYYTIPCECGGEMVSYDRPWTRESAMNTWNGYTFSYENPPLLVIDDKGKHCKKWGIEHWDNIYRGDTFTCRCGRSGLFKIERIEDE
jgi:hypothetical protein